MNIRIELNHEDVVQAVMDYVRDKYGVEVDKNLLRLEVKSRQNFKSEWERADTKVGVELRAVS